MPETPEEMNHLKWEFRRRIDREEEWKRACPDADITAVAMKAVSEWSEAGRQIVESAILAIMRADDKEAGQVLNAYAEGVKMAIFIGVTDAYKAAGTMIDDARAKEQGESR
jgi:hypothetical protein